jgi:hypothetical protein
MSIYKIALLGITTGFLLCVQAGQPAQLEGLQSVETEQWLKWDDQHAWSGIDHFLSAWKGEGSVDPEVLQEKIFQARFAVMNATAHPESAENVKLVNKNFSTLCDAFHPNTRSDCLNQIMGHKEELCKDTVVADRQSKVCNTLLQRSLGESVAEESPSQHKHDSKRVKRFRLPGLRSK